MSIGFQCVKGHRGRFVRIKPVVRYEARRFLWWSWVAEVVDGYLVRCVHPGCGRAMVVSLDGVYEPAAIAPQPDDGPREEPEERERREPLPPLGLAVRRQQP